MFTGDVVAIFIGPRSGESMIAVDSVEAIAGRGLDGDRYASGEGSFSQNPGGGRQVTLIESEAIEAVRRENGFELGPGDPRRNIVTRGVPLNHLVGSEFSVGEVRLRGIRLCEPCSHLAKLVGESIVQPLLHRAGLRTDIVAGGVVRVGDDIRPI